MSAATRRAPLHKYAIHPLTGISSANTTSHRRMDRRELGGVSRSGVSVGAVGVVI
jgi:hypothetical protein